MNSKKPPSSVPPTSRSESPTPLRLTRSGRPSRQSLEDDVRSALRLLDDPIALDGLGLASSRSVQVVAAHLYPKRTCASGLALRRLLRQFLRELAADMQGSVLGTLAAGLEKGETQASIARSLGISEEYLCRRWKPVLVQLLRDMILSAEPGVQSRAA